MSGGVELVALAARTPVGLTAEASAAAVRARVSRVVEYPFVAKNGELIRCGADALIDRQVRGRERLQLLARSVTDEFSRKLGGGKPYPGPCRLRIELPEPRPGFLHGDADWVANAIVAGMRATFPALRVDVAQRGHAGAAMALEAARAEASLGDEVLQLVIGVDSYHHPDTFEWLERQRLLAGGDVRSGFFPGEAAAGLAFAHPRLRQRLGLPALAVLTGIGTASESRGRDSETGSFGEGMGTALGRALAGRRFPDEATDAVYLDINGERYRSEEWGFVAMRHSYAVRTLDYTAPADSWGDVGAASVPLLAILAARSWARGYAEGPRAVVMCGSFGGLRGAVALEQPGVGERRGR
jgi:3-oxoacyl-[acyl-carrier-protein] synthase-1